MASESAGAEDDSNVSLFEGMVLSTPFDLLPLPAADAVDSAVLVFKNAEDTSSKKLEEWQSSMESLEIKKLETEIESCLISEARLQLEHAIDSLVEDDEKEKEMLTRKGDILAKELDELLTFL
ncbi:putative restin [Cocos nucifera]|uniref:Putative restin n=1 Tax=Cocos nucifera TaxID=13894 RepID=A0A8K0IHU6_COCNU|nr:putative restin [Cocos nucifera]